MLVAAFPAQQQNDRAKMVAEPWATSAAGRAGLRRLPKPLIGAIEIAAAIQVAHHVLLELIGAAVVHHLFDVAGDVEDLQAQTDRLEDARKAARVLDVMQSAAVSDQH